MTNENVVMSPLKGSSNFNVIPTKDTVDYDRIYKFNKCPDFKYFKANRPLDKKHVKEIQETIESGQHKAKFIAPIRVDINTLKIIDGQHRYAAFLAAWENGSEECIRVIFEDLPGDEKQKLDVVVEINSTTSNWGIRAYENRLKQEGNKSMLNIEEFAKSHPICCKRNKAGEITGYYPRYAYAVILGRNASKEVKDGTIYVSKKDLAFAEQIYSEVEKLVHALGYEIGNWFESFAHAWYNIRKTVSADSALVDTLGMELMTEHIYDQFRGWHPITRRTEWEQRFRTAIWNIKRAKDNKEI